MKAKKDGSMNFFERILERWFSFWSFLLRQQQVKMPTIGDLEIEEKKTSRVLMLLMGLGMALFLVLGTSLYSALQSDLETLPAKIQFAENRVNALTDDVTMLEELRESLKSGQMSSETSRYMIYEKLGMVAPNQIEVWEE